MSLARLCRRFTVAAAFSLAVLTSASVAQAQKIEVPDSSPVAGVKQRVGVSDFSVEYSSPGVKGRKIFGSLVPYDEVWRTGANAVSKLTASHDFTFGDKPVKAGTYAVFTIPGKTSWTVILSNQVGAWGSYAYDAKDDAARVTVKPQTVGQPRERMAFSFVDSTDDTTRLELAWDKVVVHVPLKVDTRGIINAGIAQYEAEAWRAPFTAARYLVENDGDLKKATELVDTSIALKPTWWNHWVKAQILGKQGKKAEAVKFGQQAQKLGAGERVYEGFYKDAVAKAIAGWK